MPSSFRSIENLSGRPRPNLSEPAAIPSRRARHGLATPQLSGITPSPPSSTPAYLADNAAGIRHGWPRIPLPGDAAALRASAALGARLAALLDPDTPVPGVTEGEPEPGAPRHRRAHDRAGPGAGLAAHRRLGGAHARGRHYAGPRPCRAARLRALREGHRGPGRPARRADTRRVDERRELLAQHARAGLGVPRRRLPGAQEVAELSRPLHPGPGADTGEVEHIQATARRIAAILLLGPALDAAHRACAAAHVPLPA